MRLDHLLSKEQRSERKASDSGQQDGNGNMVLFNFEAPASKDESGNLNPVRGCSSAGRAPALHAGGQEFDPPHLHQERVWNGDWLPECGLIAQLVRAHD